MDIEWIRQCCRSLPHVTEHVQWGDNLVFKVGGKIFAIAPLEPATPWLSFKCGNEEFAELIERPGIIPAPYLARAKWVALESEDALTRGEIERLLQTAHSLVFAKLPKKLQEKLNRRTSRLKSKSSARGRRRSVTDLPLRARFSQGVALTARSLSECRTSPRDRGESRRAFRPR